MASFAIVRKTRTPAQALALARKGGPSDEYVVETLLMARAHNQAEKTKKLTQLNPNKLLLAPHALSRSKDGDNQVTTEETVIPFDELPNLVFQASASVAADPYFVAYLLCAMPISQALLEPQRYKGKTCAIHLACAAGNFDCVKTMWQHRPDIICERDDSGLLPLHHAAINGHTRLCTELVCSWNAMQHLRRSANRGPFVDKLPHQLAADSGHAELAQKLREHHDHLTDMIKEHRRHKPQDAQIHQQKLDEKDQLRDRLQASKLVNETTKGQKKNQKRGGKKKRRKKRKKKR